MGIILFLALVADTGADYDAAAHKISARGAAAADLRTPSAQVARVRAERTARQRAEKKIAAALAYLGWKPCAGKKDCNPDEATAELLARAVAGEIDYGSDGSLTLTLTLSTEELKLRR